jgi:hypothetical protein
MSKLVKSERRMINNLLLFINNQHREAKQCSLLPETQYHEYSHLHWLLVEDCLSGVSCWMVASVAPQADRLVDEPRTTNMPLFLYTVHCF